MDTQAIFELHCFNKNFNTIVHPNTLMQMVSEMTANVGITHQVQYKPEK